MPKSQLIRNEKEESAELLIYGVIGDDWYGGVTAKGVKEALDEIGDKDLTVRINSPGGSVFEGSAIYNLLKSHPKNVHVVIDGACFSAASFIAMVGHKITIAANAMLMIHDPWTFDMGDAKQLRKTADLLDQIKDLIVDTYAARATDLSKEEIAELMAAETWLKPADALEKGFVDEVTENRGRSDDTTDLARNLARFKSHWKNAPQDWPKEPATPRLSERLARISALQV